MDIRRKFEFNQLMLLYIKIKAYVIHIIYNIINILYIIYNYIIHQLVNAERTCYRTDLSSSLITDTTHQTFSCII